MDTMEPVMSTKRWGRMQQWPFFALIFFFVIEMTRIMVVQKSIILYGDLQLEPMTNLQIWRIMETLVAFAWSALFASALTQEVLQHKEGRSELLIIGITQGVIISAATIAISLVEAWFALMVSVAVVAIILAAMQRSLTGEEGFRWDALAFNIRGQALGYGAAFGIGTSLLAGLLAGGIFLGLATIITKAAHAGHDVLQQRTKRQQESKNPSQLRSA